MAIWPSVFNNLFLLLSLVVLQQKQVRITEKHLSYILLGYIIIMNLSVLSFWIIEYIDDNSISFFTLTNTPSLIRYLGKNNNYLSSHLVMTLPFFIVILRNKIVPLLALSILLYCQLISLFFLASKAAIIAALLLTILITIRINQKILVKRLLQVVVCLLISYVLGFYIFDDFNLLLSGANPISSSGERIAIWAKTFQLFLQYPILGCGTNNWWILFPGQGMGDLLYSFNKHLYFQHAHNIILENLAELGLLGFSFFIAIYFSPIYYYYKSRDKELTRPYFLAAMIFLFVSMFYGVTYSINGKFLGLQILFFFSVSELSYLYHSSATTINSQSNDSMLIKGLLILVATILMSFYIVAEKNKVLFKKALGKRFANKESAIIGLRNTQAALFRYSMRRDFNYVLAILSSKNTGEAEKYFLKSLEQYPYSTKSKMKLMDLYMINGDLDKAIELGQELLMHNSSLIEVHLKLADAALQKGDKTGYIQHIKYPKDIVLGSFEKYGDSNKNSKTRQAAALWKQYEAYRATILSLDTYCDKMGLNLSDKTSN